MVPADDRATLVLSRQVCERSWSMCVVEPLPGGPVVEPKELRGLDLKIEVANLRECRL